MYCTPPLSNLMPRLVQEMASRCRHQSVCLVLTIEVCVIDDIIWNSKNSFNVLFPDWRFKNNFFPSRYQSQTLDLRRWQTVFVVKNVVIVSAVATASTTTSTTATFLSHLRWIKNRHLSLSTCVAIAFLARNWFTLLLPWRRRRRSSRRRPGLKLWTRSSVCVDYFDAADYTFIFYWLDSSNNHFTNLAGQRRKKVYNFTTVLEHVLNGEKRQDLPAHKVASFARI